MTQALEKKDQIVQAAFAVTMRDGLQGLTFEAIANEANLTRQLVRYYFADNETLMVALSDHLAGIYRQSMVSGAREINQASRLNFFLDFYFDLLEAYPKPRDDQAYDALMSFATRSEAVRTNLRTQYGLLGQVISQEIQLKYTNLRAEECLELSFLFISLMYGHWKMVASLGHNEEHRHITRRAMDRLLASYVAREYDSPVDMKVWSLNG